MKIFTIENGEVSDGTKVETFHGNPAVVVGGNGAQRGTVPVDGCDGGEIFFAEVVETSAGKKFVARESAATDEKVIVVFRTAVPGCGGNSHVGARMKNGNEIFPGEILATGTVTLGVGGRRGFGRQYVAIMPKDTIFGVKCFGREKSARYYTWDGKRILSIP